MDSSIRVDEIIGLLAKADPSALDRLKRAHPEQEKLFEPGRTLGLQGTAAAIIAAVQESERIIPWADAMLNSARNRLTAARRFEFIAQSIALVGTLSTVIVVGAERLQSKAMIPARVAFLRNLCILVAHYFRSDLRQGGSTIIESCEILSRSIPELRFTSRYVSEWFSRGIAEGDQRKLAELVNRINKLCGDINRAAFRLPAIRHSSLHYA